MMRLLPFVFLIVGLISDHIAGFELSINPPGDSHIRPRGSSMIFTCVASALEDDSAPMSYLWFKDNGKSITTGNGRLYTELSSAGMALHITNLTDEDAGTYTCRAYSQLSLLSNKMVSVNLVLYESIDFPGISLTQHPVIHTDAVVACRVTGSPTPVVSWKYEGHRIFIASVVGARYSQVADGLMIKNITQDDNGVYTCRATVDEEGRVDERRILVEVHIPPKITEEMRDFELIKGDNVRISCKASGLPSPSYKFYKDGSELVASETRIIDYETGRLRFSQLAKSDEGSYICQATNYVGTAKSYASIKVIDNYATSSPVVTPSTLINWNHLPIAALSVSLVLALVVACQCLFIAYRFEGRDKVCANGTGEYLTLALRPVAENGTISQTHTVNQYACIAGENDYLEPTN